MSASESDERGPATSEQRTGLTRRLTIPALVVLFATAVTVLHFVVLHLELRGALSVPIDDTYIHFQYARSIAEGHPFSYHPQDGYSTGCTSPLYVLLLALPYALGLRGMSLVPVTLVLGGVWLAATLLLFIRIGHKLHSPAAGRVAAALWGSCGFVWYCLYCGMESGLYVTLLLAVLCTFIGWTRGADRRRPPAALVLLASLLPLARPEGLALLAALLAVVAARVGLHRSLPARDRLHALLPWLPALLPGAAYYLANRLLTGTFSTAGMISKSLLQAPYLVPYRKAIQYATQLFETFQQFLTGADPLYLGLLVGLPGLAALFSLALRQRARRVPGPYLLMGLWVLVLLLFASMHYIRIARWTRYYLPFFLLVVLGAGFAARWAARALRRRSLAAGAALALVLFQGDAAVRWMQAYRHDVVVIHTKQAAAARAARNLLPPGSRILVCDAGAIAYLSRHWTFDVVGLTTAVRFNYFRHGVGSRFELYERLPPGQRPTHVAAYDFCLWPGARGAPMGQFHDMVLAPLVEEGAGSGHYPGPGLDGLELVDRLDVADLYSEHEHDYHFEELESNIRDNVLRRAPLAPGTSTIADGGRLIRLEETLTFRARPGQPLTVVARYSSGLPLELVLKVGKRTLSARLQNTPYDTWDQVTLRLPGREVSTENTMHVRSRRGEFYHSYHYFFLQPRRSHKTARLPSPGND